VIEGGCFCGAVRYAIDDGDYLSANCHCSMCRRIHAAPFVTWLVVPGVRFRYTQGTPQAYRSSDRGTRWFCARCGSQLTCIVDAHPDIVDVAVGALDAPEAQAPKVDAHGDTRLPWIHTGLQDVG
jgi:hypothetical protein